jgi:hypothetical protein
MNKKQSLFHIAKRDTLPWYKAVLIRGGAIVLALIVCAIVTTLLTGENPIKVYSTILYGAFGTSRKSWVTFHNLAILLGISLAVTPAFKMRFWNIGAEGQVLIGCLATAACMICLGGKIPNGLLIVIMIVARRAVGLPPRYLQGQVEHERNALHAHDELHRDTARRVLHHRVGSAQGLGQDRYHQPEYRGRLASRSRRPALSPPDPACGDPHGRYVHLSQLQQARL